MHLQCTSQCVTGEGQGNHPARLQLKKESVIRFNGSRLHTVKFGIEIHYSVLTCAT